MEVDHSKRRWEDTERSSLLPSSKGFLVQSPYRLGWAVNRITRQGKEVYFVPSISTIILLLELTRVLGKA